MILLLDSWRIEKLPLHGDVHLLEFTKGARMIRVDTDNPNKLQFGYWNIIPMGASSNVSYHKTAEGILQEAGVCNWRNSNSPS